MNENNYSEFCPSYDDCFPRRRDRRIFIDIASSIADQEDALACILCAECTKINIAIRRSEGIDGLIAIDTSVQATIEKIIILEGVLKAKLDSILPYLIDYR